MTDAPNEGPAAGRHVARLLLELLKGRRMTLEDVQEETGRSYQTARRYLAVLDELVGLESERPGPEPDKVWFLPRRSIPVHPDLYVEETGQLPLFGENGGGEGEGD